MFKRKAYDKLLEWKRSLGGTYAALLEGPRRVGKSTIAAAFAQNEYESHIIIDFANIGKDLLAVFDDLSNLDMFFLRLQAQTDTTLVPGKSVLVFDEIQLAPKVRQAIKYLVADGRYDYIETGSLISIKKNVQGIVIPSEEHRIPVHPMDYEEFCWACGKSTFDMLSQIKAAKKPVGNATNRALMRDFRVYMAVGGMPQAVDAYIRGQNFETIDLVKREIIELYKADFKKIDPSGRLAAMYESIPAQLAAKKNRFRISTATGKRPTHKDEERLFDLIDSKTVLPCYNTSNPGATLAQAKDMDTYKLYVADTGLFVTMIFNSEERTSSTIYAKLLSDSLSANLGYLYENACAQILANLNKSLFYHTWKPQGKSHAYEVDFLLADKAKIVAIEVKSSNVNNHTSIDEFATKYSGVVSKRILFSQKDVANKGSLEMKPIYLAPVIIEDIGRAQEASLLLGS